MVSPAWTGLEGTPTLSPPVLQQRSGACHHWRAPWLKGSADRWLPPLGTAVDSRSCRLEPYPGFGSASGCWGDVDSSSPHHPAADPDSAELALLSPCVASLKGAGWWNYTWSRSLRSSLDTGWGWSWLEFVRLQHQRDEQRRESTPATRKKEEHSLHVHEHLLNSMNPWLKYEINTCFFAHNSNTKKNVTVISIYLTAINMKIHYHLLNPLVFLNWMVAKMLWRPETKQGPLTKTASLGEAAEDLR